MKTKNYDFKTPQEKWAKKWEEEKIYKVDIKNAPRPFYNLMMFPYPSAAGLHAGGGFTFPGIDVYGRYMRMKGFDVFQPFGVDSFGIHGENYALKIGRHPKEVMREASDNFYAQLKRLGNGYDWDHVVETHTPEYYKWTQWIFTKLFEKGLAYRKAALVNWCPSCKTVLSDEQVIDGKCERCKSEVIKKEMEQWFFKITAYAERLLEHLDHLNWIDELKVTQRNWIGKSEGAEVKFGIKGSDKELNVFTTRVDTLFGATYAVIAPEHPLVKEITSEDKKEEVEEYIQQSVQKEDIDRMAEGKEKTGIFTGAYAINPVNSEEIPIWISDYVLMNYGTGAIMAVPAHDERDFEFAKKFNLPIRQVVELDEEFTGEMATTGYGEAINSGEFDGMKSEEARKAIVEKLSKDGKAEFKTTYKLRDWCISRQRYWGPPIPMIHCENCAGKNQGINHDGWFAVPEEDLPVKLPETTDYIPDGSGKSPLAKIESFVNTTCPNCGGPARRETDVSDNFLDSAWYFLRYPSTDFDNVIFDKEITNKWLPVDQYTGGMEHAVLHLMYARFITMALFDMGFLGFEEPFKKLNKNGIILKDGQKMSKSVGNVVNPDEYIEKYGADTWRFSMFFIGPFDQGGNFSDKGIVGMQKFTNRLYAVLEEVEGTGKGVDSMSMMHKTIKKVEEDIATLVGFNTAIAAIMEFVNWIYKNKVEFNEDQKNEIFKNLTLIIAPIAPFLAEQMWNEIGGEFSVHKQAWPTYDPAQLQESVVTIAIQINGKLRDTINVPTGSTEEVVKEAAMKSEKIQKFLEGNEPKKFIYIKDKILSIVA